MILRGALDVKSQLTSREWGSREYGFLSSILSKVQDFESSAHEFIVVRSLKKGGKEEGKNELL